LVEEWDNDETTTFVRDLAKKTNVFLRPPYLQSFQRNFGANVVVMVVQFNNQSNIENQTKFTGAEK
jgi:hypothetical protein